MRGRLIFPFMAEICRFTGAPVEDPDFKEPVRFDQDGDGVGEPPNVELPALRLRCQVDAEAYEALRMAASGETPRQGFDLLFHVSDLQRQGLLVDGQPLIRPRDRLAGLYDLAGKVVYVVATPPGLYVSQVRPTGFGMGLPNPRWNLLRVSFAERSLAASRVA